jgi:hypothetical protein
MTRYKGKLIFTLDGKEMTFNEALQMEDLMLTFNHQLQGYGGLRIEYKNRRSIR